MGVDLSLSGPAVAFFDKTGYLSAHTLTGVKRACVEKELEFFKKSSSEFELKEANDLERSKYIVNWIKTKIQLYDSALDSSIVALEGYSMNSANSRALSSIHELGGMFKHFLWHNSVPFRLYPPSDVKSAWTGSGRAKKPEMVSKCKDYFKDFTHLHAKSVDNLADATLIAALLREEAYLKLGKFVDCYPFVHDILTKTTKNNKKGYVNLNYIHPSLIGLETGKLGWLFEGKQEANGKSKEPP